ncbi:hypothetical protein RCL1_004494 [Eukaryota sp. TZLM3-RCL]
MSLIDTSIGSFVVSTFPSYSSNSDYFLELCRKKLFHHVFFDIFPNRAALFSTRVTSSFPSLVSSHNSDEELLNQKGTLFFEPPSNSDSIFPTIVILLGGPMKTWKQLCPIGFIADKLTILDALNAVPVSNEKTLVPIRILHTHVLSDRHSDVLSPVLSFSQFQKDLPHLDALKAFKAITDQVSIEVKDEDEISSSILVKREVKSIDTRGLVKVFIGKLHPKTTSSSLLYYFSACEGLDHLDVVVDDGGYSKCFAFAYFTSPRHAQIAVDSMNGKTIDGRSIRLELARRQYKSDNHNGDDSVHVAGEPSRRHRRSSFSHVEVANKRSREYFLVTCLNCIMAIFVG